MNGVTPIEKIPAQYQTTKALPKSSGFKEIYAEALQRHGCGIGKEVKHEADQRGRRPSGRHNRGA